MSAAKHWAVIAVDEHGTGHGDCGHLHPSAVHATMCEWTPDPWPERCDLLVRQMRTRGHEQPAPAIVRQMDMFSEGMWP